jgi:Cys-tRNA(Pro)/Cys-tRNA(Cys) deacylase
MELPAHAHLDRLALPYQRRSFPPTTEKGAAAVAPVVGIEERQAVKTLIFEVDTGEQVLVMVGGDRSAISGHLKRAIGSRNIRMADPTTVLSLTGYVIGSIPPFHWQPPGFRTFVDAALMEEPILGVGAGQWGEEIMLAPTDLVRASAAEVVNLTDRDRPVRPGEG